MMLLGTEVVEPGAYGFYYLATGLLGTGFVTLIIAIFIYFWRTQKEQAAAMQTMTLDNALMKRDMAQMAKDMGEMKESMKEHMQHSPAALQEAVFELLEKLKGVKK
jgi:hypothetical protein